MAKLGGLINGQDVTFDTHQSGDGQDTQWRNVHLEKRLHNGGGKARFHLLSDDSSSSGMNSTEFTRVTKEVKRALRKHPRLFKQLAEEVVNTLARFSRGTATISDARVAAQIFARHFDLDKRFLQAVEDRAKGRLVSFTTVHHNPTNHTFHEIVQSADSVQLRQVPPPGSNG